MTNESCEKYPTACNEYGTATKGQDGALNTQYFNPASVKASTTNNYTGIFDMSGGAWEYIMAGMEDSLGSNKLASGFDASNNSGFNGKNSDSSVVSNGIKLPIDSRYYDIYKYSTDDKDNSRFIFGDATGELGPFKSIQYKGTSPSVGAQTRYISSWYGENGSPVYTSHPWVCRGGSPELGIEAGLFSFDRRYGSLTYSTGFRLVLAF